MTDKPPPKPRKPRARTPAKPAEKGKAGRPPIYTDELGKAICVGLMGGASLRRVCRGEGMPDRETVYQWLLDPEKYPDFSARYARAREMQAHALADDTMDIADDSTNDFMEKKRADGETVLGFDSEHVQRSKVRIETRKWLAGAMAPTVYGVKQEIKHSGEIAQPTTDNPEAAKAEIARWIEEERARQKASGESG